MPDVDSFFDVHAATLRKVRRDRQGVRARYNLPFALTPPHLCGHERDARPPEVHLSGEPKHCPLTRIQHTETPQDRECCHLRRCSRLVAFAACSVGKHDSRNALSCPLPVKVVPQATQRKRISNHLSGRIGTVNNQILRRKSDVDLRTAASKGPASCQHLS
jgi:hypothetical protein